jgi:hypothetical protein
MAMLTVAAFLERHREENRSSTWRCMFSEYGRTVPVAIYEGLMTRCGRCLHRGTPLLAPDLASLSAERRNAPSRGVFLVPSTRRYAASR